MKTTLLALAAALSLAVAAPSLALAHSGDQTPPTKTDKPAPKKKLVLVKKQKLVKPKKLVVAKINCAKPVMIKGVKRCPVKGAAPK